MSHPVHGEFLFELLRQPTAPYREEHVVATVGRFLDSAGVPYFHDPVGNVIVGVAHRRAYRELIRQVSGEPVRLFIAHMDHPGFHGSHWTKRSRLTVKWHGGSPVSHLAGAPVWLADAGGWLAEGELVNASLAAARRRIDTAEVRVSTADSARLRARPAKAVYGGFRFRAPVWRSGRRLYTKAADDLIGVYTVCATAAALFAKARRSAPGPFIGLLTRAEEVGFIGAVGHFELAWLDEARRPVVAVSLEASRTLPGAVIGKGPVVRLGDWRTVFDAGGLKVLSDLAERVLPQRHQRRIMDGGVCEATAATAYGIPAIGNSVPLGNYHNEGFEGGPDCRHPRGPAPEFVHLDDIHGQLQLCRGLMQPHLAWSDPWRRQKRGLRKNFRAAKTLLHPRRK